MKPKTKQNPTWEHMMANVDSVELYGQSVSMIFYNQKQTNTISGL